MPEIINNIPEETQGLLDEITHIKGNIATEINGAYGEEVVGEDFTQYASAISNMSRVGRTTESGGEIFNDYQNNTAAEYAHAEGYNTKANGNISHTEGRNTEARAEASHAEGDGTVATTLGQHAGGVYNIIDEDGNYLEVIGNGTSSARSNARTLDKQGNAWYAGNIIAAGGSITIGNKTLTESDITTLLQTVESYQSQIDALKAQLANMAENY